MLFQLGVGDLAEVLDAIANTLPEMSVGVLSDAATKANKAIAELLSEARRVREDQQARATTLLESLEKVEEFVSEKYYEALAGEDDQEANAKQALEAAMASLRQLKQEANKMWMATPTSPFVLDVPTKFQPPPRDQRWLPLVGAPSL